MRSPAQITEDLTEGGTVVALLEAVPVPLLVVDAGMSARSLNWRGKQMLDRLARYGYRRRGKPSLDCLRGAGNPDPDGSCDACAIRRSVAEAIRAGSAVHQHTIMQPIDPAEDREIHLSVEASPLRLGGQDLAILVLRDVSELVCLRGLIPMCSWCRRIRDDQQYWRSVEQYFKERLDLDFSHGLCPDCLERQKSQGSGPPTERTA